MSDDPGPHTDDEAGAAVPQSGADLLDTGLTPIAVVTQGNRWAGGRLFGLVAILAVIIIGTGFCAAAVRGDTEDVVSLVGEGLVAGGYDQAEVAGEGGTITLTGSVETDAARDEAGAVALATAGVQRVINELEVIPNQESGG